MITLSNDNLTYTVLSLAYRYAEQRANDPRLKDLQQLDVNETMDADMIGRGTEAGVSRLRTIMRNYLTGNQSSDTDMTFRFKTWFSGDESSLEKLMEEYLVHSCMVCWLNAYYPNESVAEENYKTDIGNRILKLLYKKPSFDNTY